jgi:hypothetical protein
MAFLCPESSVNGFQAGTPNLDLEVSCVLVEEAVFPQSKKCLQRSSKQRLRSGPREAAENGVCRYMECG